MRTWTKRISIGAALLFGLIMLFAFVTLALIDQPGPGDDLLPLFAAGTALVGLVLVAVNLAQENRTAAKLVGRAEYLRDVFLRYGDEVRTGIRSGDKSAVEDAMAEAQRLLAELRSAEKYEVARDLSDAMRHALLETGRLRP